MTPEYQIVANGESALTLTISSDISIELSALLIAIDKEAKQAFNESLRDTILGYQSLTLWFDISRFTAHHLAIEQAFDALVKKYFSATNPLADKCLIRTSSSKLIEIPVCYEGLYAPDLSALAKHCNISVEEVIERHTAPEYFVHLIGFMPGFLYLGGLDPSLQCPRKSTPSLAVEPGAVAIGGAQTGIYPTSSPGGWHVIGQTPVTMFNLASSEVAVAKPLDRIRFVAISAAHYQALKSSTLKVGAER